MAVVSRAPVLLLGLLAVASALLSIQDGDISPVRIVHYESGETDVLVLENVTIQFERHPVQLCDVDTIDPPPDVENPFIAVVGVCFEVLLIRNVP